MGACDICGRIPSESLACDTCKKSEYCSSNCRLLGTKDHKLCNPPGSLRPVDYLYIDIFGDTFPANPDVVREYGFAKCETQDDWTHLFGLYIGMLRILEIPRDELHDYCRRDEIGALIIKVHQRLELYARGVYYSWFLEHQHVVKKATAAPKNLGESSKNPKKNSKPGNKFANPDGKFVINYGYGYNGEELYYYLNVQDARLAWQDGLPKDVENVTNVIDSTGEGIVIQLHTSSSSMIKGHQVSVETLAVFFKRYGIKNAHIEKMKQRKLFK